MRVGLVMHGLDRPLSGVTRVALELARALQLNGACELVLLSTSRRAVSLEGIGADVHHLPGCERVPGLMLLGGPLLAVAARRLALDVIHDPVGVSPFTLGRWAGAFKRVVTIHDAIAFRYPEGYSWSNNFLHRRYVPATLRNVDQVITVSENSRADLHHFLGLDEARVSVVPNAAGTAYQPLQSDVAASVAQRYGLRPPYVLHVGTTQARKNIEGLLAAFEALSARLPGHQLALVGPDRLAHDSLRDRIDARGLMDHVRIVGPVPEEDLPALYSGASLFAFPSLFEGFGLPVLEAMACGTPVVASNTTSLPEVAGSAAMLVDPRDTHALAQAMYRVLTERSLRDSLRELGLRRARSFTWERTSRETAAVYGRVLSGSSRR